MTSKIFYYYKQEKKIIKTEEIPQGVEYETKTVLTADEGKTLTDGNIMIKTIACNAEDVDKWTEVDAPAEDEEVIQ